MATLNNGVCKTMIDSSASTTCFSPQIGAWIEPRNDSRVDRDRSRSFSRSLSLRSIQGRTRNRSNISPLDRERSRRVLPEDQGIQGSRGSAFIPIATGAVGPVAVAAAVSLLSPTVLSALSPVPVSVPSPSAAARSCCVADDRCSCGSAGCSGSSIPACRCYRSIGSLLGLVCTFCICRLNRVREVRILLQGSHRNSSDAPLPAN